MHMVIGTSNQRFQNNKVFTGATLFFVIGPIYTPHAIYLNTGS